MFLALVVAAATAAEAVLAAPAQPVAPGEPVSFTFALDGVSWLDGCAPVELERQEGAKWVALARTPCPAGPAATRVEGALVVSVPPPPVGTYRGTAAFGTGCLADRSFATAACAALAIARSEVFTVAPAATSTP
jgi:hypothetical protein